MNQFQAKVVAATTGSTLTALTMTPFDVVKTRLQTQPPLPQSLFPNAPLTCCQPPNLPCTRNLSYYSRTQSVKELVCVWDHGVLRSERVHGFWDAIKHVWRAEGFPGLWKGVGTTLVIGVPASTAYMITYDYLLNSILPSFIPQNPLLPLYAGILARSSITTLISPLELVRTNLQSTPPTGQSHSLTSVLRSLRRSVHKQGVGYIWRGLSPTLWRDVPFSGLYWASYQACKDAFNVHNYSGPPVAFFSGAFSGVLAALITSPFDVLKTRRQAFLMTHSNSGHTRTVPLLRHIAASEGFSALYAGILPRITKIAPACGIMIACYEGVGSYLTRTVN